MNPSGAAGGKVVRAMNCIGAALALGLALHALFVFAGPMPAAIAIALYAIAHLLRIVRIGVFFIFDRPSGTRLASQHLWTAWLSATLPFKLGELARLWMFSRMSSRPGPGVAAYATEKLLDASALFLGIALLSLTGQLNASLGLLTGVLIVALAGVVGAYLAARGATFELRRLIVARSRSARGTHALRVLNAIDNAYESARSMLSGRLPVLVLLTACIWIFDFLAFLTLASPRMPFIQEAANFLLMLEGLFQPPSPGRQSEFGELVTLVLAVAAVPASIWVIVNALPREARRKRHEFEAKGLHKRYAKEEGSCN
jgi:hypothetical protein